MEALFALMIVVAAVVGIALFFFLVVVGTAKFFARLDRNDPL